MSVRRAGLEVYFEPAAEIAYVRPPPFALSDLPFFFLRWSESWSRQTLEHYHAKWNLEIDELDRTLSWLKKHRYRFLQPIYEPPLELMFRTLGRKRTRRLLQLAVFPIEGALNRLFIRDRGKSRRR